MEEETGIITTKQYFRTLDSFDVFNVVYSESRKNKNKMVVMMLLMKKNHRNNSNKDMNNVV